MDFQLNKRTMAIVFLIFLAAFSRLIPHDWNFTPVMALALFGSAFLENKKLAFIIPLTSMILSDIFLGFHSLMFAVYFSIAIAVFLGMLLFKKGPSVLTVLTASLSSSVIFFVITNFWIWLFDGWYPTTIPGLITCFEMALPFFRSTLLGDLGYSVLFFGGFALAERYIPSLKLSNS